MSRVPRPPSGAPFLAFQLGGGLLGTTLWAVLSHEGPALVGAGAATLAYGMVLYLPLTLGLPFVLPNLYRKEASRPAEARSALSMLAGTTALAALVALVAAPMGIGPLTWGSGLGFAALIAASATIQQIARVQRSLPLMAAGSAYNMVIPGVCLMLSATGSTDVLLGPLVAVMALLVTPLLIVHARALPAGDGDVRRVLRRAAPLVPHMVAFGVLTQGVRLPASLTDTDPAQPHSIMLVVGLALAVVSGVNSLLTVAIQTCSASELSSVIRQNLRYYAALGTLGSIGATVFYGSPLRGVFAGAEPLDPLGLAALAVIPPAFCAYFFGSALVLRSGRTGRLPAVSVPIAVAYVVVSVAILSGGASVEAALATYAGALLLLALGAVLAARSSEQSSP